jgi:hypothetical protein
VLNPLLARFYFIFCCKKKGAMVGLHISFGATFGWIAIGQNGSSSL